MGAARDAALSGRNRAHRQSIAERQLAVDQMSRETDTKIRRDSPAKATVCLHRLIFPSRQPKLNSRQAPADLDDFPQVIEALQIAGIVPAKVAISRAVDERRYRIHPAGVGETDEALFHGSLNLPKDVPTAKRVTVMTNGFRELLQEAAEPASLCWQRIAVAGHLSRLAQGAA